MIERSRTKVKLLYAIHAIGVNLHCLPVYFSLQPPTDSLKIPFFTLHTLLFYSSYASLIGNKAELRVLDADWLNSTLALPLSRNGDRSAGNLAYGTKQYEWLRNRLSTIDKFVPCFSNLAFILLVCGRWSLFQHLKPRVSG
jgi:hypothetical protein